METITTAGGRTLAYEVVGDPDGTPVFFQHGTGDSRLCKHPDDSVTAALGVRLVTADRPGVGGSTPRKPRTILDWVDDRCHRRRRRLRAVRRRRALGRRPARDGDRHQAR